MCDATCSCEGILPAASCPLVPGCPECTHTYIIVVRLAAVDLLPGETIDRRVRRDDMLRQLPPRYQGRPN
jgi:hypothetical protein